MKFKLFSQIVILVLVLGTAACGKPQDVPQKAAPTLPAATSLPATQVPATQVPAPTVKPAGPQLGDVLRNEPGGFSVASIPGYTVLNDGESMMLVAPDGDPSRGPAVLIGGMLEPALEGMSLPDVAALLAGDMAFTQSPVVEVTTAGGVPGITRDLLGVAENEGTQGKLAVLRPNATQVVMLMGVAPLERWPELLPYFDALWASVETFAPSSAAVQPAAPALSLPAGYDLFTQVAVMGKLEPALALLGQPAQTLKEHGYRGQMLQSVIYRFNTGGAAIEVIANPAGDVVYKAFKSSVSGSLPDPALLEQVQPGMSLTEVQAVLGSGYLLSEFVDARDTTRRFSVQAWPGQSGQGQLAVMFLNGAAVKKVFDQPGLAPAPDSDASLPRIPLLLAPATNSFATSVLGNADYAKYLTIPLDSTLEQVKAVFGEPASQTESPASAAIKSITYNYNGNPGQFSFKIKVPDAAVLLLPEKDNLLISKSANRLNEVSDLRKRHVQQVKKGMTLAEIEQILGGPGRVAEQYYNDAGQVVNVYAWSGTQYSTTVKAVFIEGSPTANRIDSSASDERYELDSLYEDYILILP